MLADDLFNGHETVMFVNTVECVMFQARNLLRRC